MTDTLLTAKKLIQVGAVKLSVQQPFTWASGLKSPIYCDNRKILSHPYIRDFIKSELCNVAFEKFDSAQVIAAVATAGISWGAMVADQLKLPFLYVRPKPKEHGLANQIEGELMAGQKVLVLEDLVSTGKSSLQVVNVLRAQGAHVVGMISIFTYEFSVAKEAFSAAGVELYSLTNFPSLLKTAQETGQISQEEEEVLLNWREAPENWQGVA